MHQHLNYRVPEEEGKKKEYEKIFEEIIAENFKKYKRRKKTYKINPKQLRKWQ